MTKASNSAEVLTRWYDTMWLGRDFDRIPDIAAPVYLRHDITGANNAITAQGYRDMLKAAPAQPKVTEFQYHLIEEGEFVGAIGRYLVADGRQWDWVQMFRVINGRLAETWLSGMGGTDPGGYPRPANRWTGGEIPSGRIDSAAKQVVHDWYCVLAGGADGDPARCLASEVRIHDITASDRTVSAADHVATIRARMNASTVTVPDLFLIAQDDFVMAVGSWTLDGQRQWDWVEAFRMASGRIAESWLPTLSGNDPTIVHCPQTAWPRSVMPAQSVNLLPTG